MTASPQPQGARQPAPLVTVIVTTYNQEDTIARTLDSVLAQVTDFPFEILIGEDCSTDSTAAICQEYAASHPDRIRLICNPVNKGLRDNYYDCILAARGKYIADCAGDDFWCHPAKLQSQTDLLEAHPEVTLVHTDWQFRDSATGATSPSDPAHTLDQWRKPFAPGAELIPAILAHTKPPVVHLCTALYRRDTMIKAFETAPHLYRCPDWPCEDLQVECAMAAAGSIAFLPECTLNYSVGHESVSNIADPGREFDYTLGTLSLTHALTGHYGASPPLLYYRRAAHHLVALAYHSLIPGRMRAARRAIPPETPLRPTTRLMLALAACPPLWRAAERLQRALRR